MYVSTVNVLRKFAQKMAAVELKDPAHMSPAERKQFDAQMNSDSGASDKTRAGLPKPDMSDRAHLAVHAGREAVGKGVNSAIGAGKSLGHTWQNYAAPMTVGAGGLGGAALMYAIAKMRQSEEERKRGKQPILAPALGLAGGAVAAPLLAALMHKYQNPSNGPALAGTIENMDAIGTGTGAAPASAASSAAHIV